MLRQNKRSIRVSSGGQNGRRARVAPAPKGGPRRRNRYGARKRGLHIRTGRRRMSAQDTARKRHIDPQYLAAVRDFETAVRHFQKQKFDKAKEIFEKLVSSPALEVAARARVHLQLCEQKLSAERAPAAKTAEDYYNLGVMELNARSLDQAVEHLSKADKLAPNREHIRYVLAAAHALQGNTGAALEHLSAAISLRPENRIRARRDEDFRLLASDPRFRQLISG